MGGRKEATQRSLRQLGSWHPMERADQNLERNKVSASIFATRNGGNRDCERITVCPNQQRVSHETEQRVDRWSTRQVSSSRTLDRHE